MMVRTDIDHLEIQLSLAQHYAHTLERTVEQLERAATELHDCDNGFFDGMWARMDEFLQAVKDRRREVLEYEGRLEDDLEAMKSGDTVHVSHINGARD